MLRRGWLIGQRGQSGESSGRPRGAWSSQVPQLPVASGLGNLTRPGGNPAIVRDGDQTLGAVVLVYANAFVIGFGFMYSKMLFCMHPSVDFVHCAYWAQRRQDTGLNSLWGIKCAGGTDTLTDTLHQTSL